MICEDFFCCLRIPVSGFLQMPGILFVWVKIRYRIKRVEILSLLRYNQ
jgi:hypothetical protein